MPLTKRELGTPWAKHSAAAVALGLLLGFAGPFGSYPAFERPVRYAFWLGLTLFGYLCALAAAAMVRATPAMARLPEPLQRRFIDEVTRRAAQQPEPFTLDYWRLNMEATRA